MATVNKPNQTLYTRGTLYETLQVRAFKIEVAAALTASTSAVVNGETVVTRGTIAQVAEEFGTTAMLFQASADGTTFVVIGDAHALDLDTIARRADRALGGTGALTSVAGADTATTALVTGVTQISTFIGITQ
jgi:hypothetical protein